MPHVPGLRSPYARVGRIVYFGRMLDKIRLHAAGRLPPDYVSNLGEASPHVFDARCCRFLGVRHADLAGRVRAGGTDLEVLAWAEAHGTPRTDEDCAIWNRFMTKIGWRDDRAPALAQRIQQFGLPAERVHTAFDVLDVDEGRDPLQARPWEFLGGGAFVVMGASGSGKTTIGSKLAAALGWSFLEGDEFHPPENIAKMSAGTPLDDRDREPWLRAIRAEMETRAGRGESTVVACSALKQIYREQLCFSPAVRFIFLQGTRDVLERRLEQRQGHFMKARLLDSQLAALEPPDDAVAVDISLTPDQIVHRLRELLCC